MVVGVAAVEEENGLLIGGGGLSGGGVAAEALRCGGGGHGSKTAKRKVEMSKRERRERSCYEGTGDGTVNGEWRMAGERALRMAKEGERALRERRKKKKKRKWQRRVREQRAREGGREGTL